MGLAFESMVAGRYLRSRRREGFISVIAGFSFLGIMLGVATLIIVMAVMNGFRDELVGRIIGLNGQINVYAASGSVSSYAPVVDKLKAVPGVVSAAPVVEGQALLSVEGAAGGVVVRGMTAGDFAQKKIISSSILDRLPGDQGFGEDYVAIGKSMAEHYRLGLGDKILLIAPKGKVTPFGSIPRSKAFLVGSIFDVGMYEYNSSFVYMPLDRAQMFFDTGEGVDSIEVATPDATNVDGVKSDIAKALGGGYAISDWRDSNASFYNALEVESNVMFLILTLIIIVAAFNIISSLIMLVKDKGQDIAILRTMGATRGMIVRVFFYTGATIGIVGTLAGGLLGVVFCRNIEAIRHWLESLLHRNLFSDEIYFLTKLPAKMEPTETALIIGMSLVLSFLATLYPAWRAARLDPVEGLRRE